MGYRSMAGVLAVLGTMAAACGGMPPADVAVQESAARRGITVSQLAGIRNGFGDSFMSSFMLFPCYGQAAQDCLTTPTGFCPNANPALPIEQRGLVTHEYFTLGGTRGTNYRVTLSVRGIAEGRYYTGGVRAAGEGPIPNPDDPNGIDTFYTGGAPVNLEFYNVYKLVVRNPPAAGAPPQSGTEVAHYYLNSMPQNTGVSFQNHDTFPIHSTHQITVPGGGVIEYLTNDPNCRAIDNCGPGPRSSSCGNSPASRFIPGESTLPMPQTYLGQQVASLNVVNGRAQPFHAQVLHLAVTAVSVQ